jgi:F0F1-type ATP synthase membrane subunit b/b'
MSTGAIIAIVVAVVVVLAILFLLVPRMRAGKRQRQLEGRRHDAAQAHRTAAERRAAEAELAEREAEKARADARLHETRAELHEDGLADDELTGQTHERRRDGERTRSDTAAADRERQRAERTS